MAAIAFPGYRVVDDDRSMGQLVKTFPEDAEYVVLFAAGGAPGLALYRQNRPAVSFLPSDVEMPQMNGLDLADRVLELDWKLPVVISVPGRGNAESRVRLCG